MFVYSAAFAVVYSFGIPLCFYLALVWYNVPGLAHQKHLDQAVAEIVLLYKKRHLHDLDSLVLLLGLPKSARGHRTDDDVVREKSTQLYAECLELGKGVVNTDVIVELMEERDALCVSPEFLASVVAQHARKRNGQLSPDEFCEVRRPSPSPCLARGPAR